MNAPIDDWKREADVLSKGLLASLDDCPSEMRDALFLRLTPDDFGDKEDGEAFLQRRDQWLASRLEEENADPADMSCAKPISEAEASVERLVRLRGAIRLAETAASTLSAVVGDLAAYDCALEELGEEVGNRLRRLGLLRTDPEVWDSSRTRITRMLGNIEKRWAAAGSDLPCPLGWADLREINQVAGPLQPGRLYLLGSAPGEGKTAFLSMLARGFSTNLKRCGFFALRESSEALALRMICGQGGVAPELFATGCLKSSTHLKLTNGLVDLCECFPALAGCHDTGSAALIELARSLVSIKRLEVLLVDDLGFVLQGRDFASSHAGLFRTIAALRDLAVEMRIPVVASVGLDVADSSAGASPKAEEVLLHACMDFFAVLTASRNADGGVIHHFEVLRNSFGPPVKLPLVYQRRHHRFFPLSSQVAES